MNEFDIKIAEIVKAERKLLKEQTAIKSKIKVRTQRIANLTSQIESIKRIMKPLILDMKLNDEQLSNLRQQLRDTLAERTAQEKMCSELNKAAPKFRRQIDPEIFFKN